MIQAEIIADSIGPTGDRLTTLEIVFPRYILAELNTHRLFSKNSASSRAIPFRKMLKEVLKNPFIPYAFQKDHLGMQGTEYFDKNTDYSLPEFLTILSDTFKYQSDLEFNNKEDKQILSLLTEITDKHKDTRKTLEEWWLYTRDKAVKCAILLASLGITKQLANRLLEPFMYHKVLISSTEWENFFNLRCPKYTFHDEEKEYVFKSKKDIIAYFGTDNPIEYPEGCTSLGDLSTLQWLNLNTGQADIHMMFLAEAIYDAIQESEPKVLQEGEWHIPYGDNMSSQTLDNWLINTDYGRTDTRETLQCKISTARCARLSYQTLGDNPEINYEKDLELYEVLSKSGHWSPFEHVARVMTNREYDEYLKGRIHDRRTISDLSRERVKALGGWCRNFKGFIQYRELLD